MLLQFDWSVVCCRVKRRLCQASVYFTWNMNTGQHRVIDFDLPVDIDCSNRFLLIVYTFTFDTCM